MECNFKVEGIIWKVIEGETTEIKINDDIFVKKSSLDKTHQIVKPLLIEQPTDIDNKEIPIPSDKHEDIDRGESIGKNIHRNVLHAVIQAVKERKKQGDIKQIISKYHPDVTNESLSTYAANYKKYIIKHYPELKNNVPVRFNQFKKEVDEKLEEPKDKRGKIIARIGHNTVFEWPLRAFKRALKEERDRSYLEGIIFYYYGTTKKSSMNTYLSCYKRYINKTYDENKLEEVSVFDESEDLYKQLPPLETFLYKSIKSKQQLPERYDGVKGQCIGYIGSNSIYENVLTDIKTSIIENKTKKQIIHNILKSYHPKASKQSRTTYYRSYIRWIHQEEKLPMQALSFERKKKKDVKHDGDIVGFDESYKREISKDEIKKVKKAIMHVELNYEPTTKNICKQTGFTEHIVRSTIHWMIDNDLVKMKYNENLIPLYTLTEPNGSGESDI